jgi:acid stress chaperone HdeB
MSVKSVVLGTTFVLCALPPAQAQVTVDVDKITCDQFVHHKITEPNLIAAWLSGYYNAKRNNRRIDLETLSDNVSKLKNYCSDEKISKPQSLKQSSRC